MSRQIEDRAIAIVGVGAILPDAPTTDAFWENVKTGRYSISDVPPDRWDPELYYDPDPKAPAKTYSRIGGWVREWEWEPMKWRLPVPPKVSAAMDRGQQWAVSATRQVLADYGYPERPLNPERTAVILGNAMAGDSHYWTAMRIVQPEFVRMLQRTNAFADLPDPVQEAIARELDTSVVEHFREITEDTMPGELGNIIAGRVANLFNFQGTNYVCDAACASAMAAITAAVEGLLSHDFDAVITGGIDANMGPWSFTKFCKIGALSATGTRPYADGADGFVMGEGAGVFLLKRLADAERDGDPIAAVILGLGGSSDGRGKGITAPNPVGQRLAIERGWQKAGVRPDAATLIEGHGTSTKVGDVVEVESLAAVFRTLELPAGSIPLGSVKSNIGHLKGAAGAAGILKATLALRDKILPPSIGFDRPNPNVDFSRSPFHVITELRPWEAQGTVRRAGISAFGFGGTNFHAVLEEYVPGKRSAGDRSAVAFAKTNGDAPGGGGETKKPLRGALLLGGHDQTALIERLRATHEEAKAGRIPEPTAPARSDLRAEIRIAIDYGNAAELAKKTKQALDAFAAGKPLKWRLLQSQGIYLGRGPAPKVAFLFTGQGSQYVNMVRALDGLDPVVSNALDEADRTSMDLIGKPLRSFLFADPDDKEEMKAKGEALRQTRLTQPSVLTVDTALERLLESYGVVPDMVMGHSLGEYGALVAARAVTFPHAVEAVSARAREMTNVLVEDQGLMAAVMGPREEIEKILETVEGYVVIANINSNRQSVIGGASPAVEAAMEACAEAGFPVQALSVSHAFHTSIVAPASEPMKVVLRRMNLQAPRIPLVSNVTGDFYPTGPDAPEQMVDLLARQIAEPVQFVKGLQTLYDTGARVFVESGPKRALSAMAEDVLGDRDDVVVLSTNHPKLGDVTSFNRALCGLYAAGLGAPAAEPAPRPATPKPARAVTLPPAPAPTPAAPTPATQPGASRPLDEKGYLELGRMFADFLDQSMQVYTGQGAAPQEGARPDTGRPSPAAEEPVVVTGASMGLPGAGRVFDDANVERILRGDQFIGSVPAAVRHAMLDKRITRLVKTERGTPRFMTIDNIDETIKLAGRGGELDLVEEFGFPADRLAALDRVTELAIGAGLDALRDAGIPLTMRYKTTTTGSRLPERWGLPDALRDDTGVIFACAFPGANFFANETRRFHEDRARRERLTELEQLRVRFDNCADEGVRDEIDRRIAALRAEIEQFAYTFDRRFLFRLLAMGHSQFAELIGARGPNTQVNAACASTTLAVGLAEDWIRAGRCRRVVIISADDVSSDDLMGWIGAGFLASGAAATDAVVEDAAIPFDRRRHGMIVGMGAAALVVESAAAARERGLQPICEVLSAVTANSAFHGTRLDVDHITQIAEQTVAEAERRWGIDRHQIAPHTVFISHETYTPARGGSAQAEVNALRAVFGDNADRIVVSNTKGFTGHAMGTGIEDVVAVKSLETGIVPPVPNFKEIDPELGALNLSRGGSHPVQYALRLGAGFGSQISLSLLRWVPTADGRRRAPSELGFAYRVADPRVWSRWIATLSGHPTAQLEVVKRQLRIVDQGPPEPGSAGVRTAALAAPRAAPAPQPSPAAATQATPAPADPVQTKVLAIVAATTGYPSDMLDLDLDMEADLGIDTVKQAETFAAIRKEWDIPRDDNLQLRDFPTISHAIGFVYDRRPDLQRPTPGPAPAVTAPTTATATAPAHAASDDPAPTASDDPVQTKVLAIVAEITGYPPDMLELDLDMEADLGIDTVKQAETFAAIRKEWDIPRDDNLQLRDFPTISHAIGFVYDRRPDLQRPAPGPEPAVTAPTTATAASDNPAPAASDDPVRTKVLAIVAETTGYPPDMLELDLDMEADLGIDTVKQAETFAAIRKEWDIPRDDDLQLRDFPTISHAIGFVYDRRPDLQRPAPGPAPAVTALTTATATAPPTAASDDPAPAASDDPVRTKVLAIVAETTGYPPDMLELDLDMEADLGIDTVKQAETFAAIRKEWDIPRDDDLQLRDFPTIAHAIGFVYDRRPDLHPGSAAAAPTAASAQSADAATASPTDAQPRGDHHAAQGIPRRIPVAVLRPPLQLCKPTGVALVKGSRVVVMPDRAGVGEALKSHLEARDVDALVLDPESTADGLAARIAAWREHGPIQGVFWLPALDHEGGIADLDSAGWRSAVDRRVKLLYHACRALYEELAANGAFLVAATRLGGRHGYDDAGAWAPMGGAVVGFTKALRRERPDALVKAIDFTPDEDPGAVAERLVDETLRDPGAVEIGYQGGQRWTVGLEERALVEGGSGVVLGPDSVAVVTGAAGSIVSAIVADLARSGGTFHLLDLTPTPDPADDDLMRFRTDREGLKRELFERIKASGERATPAKVERELAALERRRAALDAIAAVQDGGGTAHYHQVDLLDSGAVHAVFDSIRQRHDRIDVLMHAAGLEISRVLPDKEPREFDLVFDVKSEGFYHLLRAIGDLPVGAAVGFSSVAGRFGNLGQTDYSAANDLLCKYVSSFRTYRPGTRGLALDWTAWAQIGMAARGSIPKMMEQAGIEMLPPDAAIPIVRRELAAGDGVCEIVVGRRLGTLLDEPDPTGGLTLEMIETKGPMVSRVLSMGVFEGLEIETDLDPQEQPFLFDHQIDGTPVLPGVMGIEAFAETAGLLHPDWQVVALRDVEFLAPFKFYRGEPRPLQIHASFHAAGDEGLVATCRLVGVRKLANLAESQITEHFRGRVQLLPTPTETDVGKHPAPPASIGTLANRDLIYQLYFHGPAYQVLESAWIADGAAVGVFAKDLPAHHRPQRAKTTLQPRLIELCFQTAGLWEMSKHGRMGLPAHIDELRLLRSLRRAKGRLRAVARPTDGGFDVEVVDEPGKVFMTLSGYRTIELPGAIPPDALAALQKLGVQEAPQ